jgi:hypothetical protein
MTSTNPTPTPNPYGPSVVAPNVPKGLPGAPIAAPVQPITDFASQNAAAAAAHNKLVQANSGGRVGGSKSKSKSKSKSRTKSKSKSKSRSKSKSKSKSRSKQSKQSKRTKRSGSKRQKRGGLPTPTPTVKAVTVPQFAGLPSANDASVGGNHLIMKGAAQAALDNTNAPPTNTKLA